MQRSKCKNANPKKVETRGFSRCPNPGFGFGKMSGLAGYSSFSKPGFQSLIHRHSHTLNRKKTKPYWHPDISG